MKKIKINLSNGLSSIMTILSDSIDIASEIAKLETSLEEGVSVIDFNVLSDADIENLTEIAKKPEKISGIKAEANKRILAAYPEWKQRNHMAAVVDIQNKELKAIKANVGYTLTPAELATVTAAQVAKTTIFNIRSKSDALEASLDAMTLEELEAFDPANDLNWV